MSPRILLYMAAAVGCGAAPPDDVGAGSSSGLVEDPGATSDTAELDVPAAPEHPARGIRIVEVEANQGVRVPIATGAQAVPPSARDLPLLAGRPTLVRVHFDVDEDWIPRELVARLTLSWPDGTAETLEEAWAIEGPSSPDALGLAFVLPPEMARAGARFQVQLLESGDTPVDLPPGIPASPADGPADLGLDDAPAEIAVVLVPIVHGDRTPTVDDALVKRFETALFQLNPVRAIELTVREPVAYGDPLDDLAPLLTRLSTLRLEDGAEGSVYYHALVDVGAPTVGGETGLAASPDPGDETGFLRVAATVLHDPTEATLTFVHEHGHMQGMRHAPCPGRGTTDVDPAYPSADGTIGTFGIGVIDLELHGPAAHDYMSYCDDVWVSPFTWRKVHARIVEVSAAGK